MRADEAYKQSLAFKDSTEVNARFEDVMTMIKDASAKGYFAINYRSLFVGNVNQIVTSKLKELGYVVKHDGDQREGKDWTTISWAK